MWKSQEFFTRLFQKFCEKEGCQESLEANGVSQRAAGVVWDCLEAEEVPRGM